MYTIYDNDKNDFIEVNEPDASLTYTYADYLQWKFEERLELFRGKIFKLAAPNTMHQKIAGKLYLRIGNFLEKQKCQVFIAPFDVRLPVKNKKKDHEITTVVQPDLCIVCDETKIDDRGCCGAPDVIVEILSPGNSKKEVQNKFELYEEAGVAEYWIINPSEENLIIYTLQNSRYTGSKPYAPGEIISSNNIPGFKITVADIFNY